MGWPERHEKNFYEIYLLHKSNQDRHPKFITFSDLAFPYSRQTLTRGETWGAFPHLRCERKSLEAPCAALPLCLEYFCWAAWPDQPTSDTSKMPKKRTHTVDGRHPAPVDMVNISLSHYLRGFIHPRWCRISSINSIPHFSQVQQSKIFKISPDVWSWQAFRNWKKPQPSSHVTLEHLALVPQWLVFQGGQQVG